jgi:regulator of replication initiation timing
MDSTKRIEQITDKINRLADVLRQLRTENASLLQENERLKAEVSNQTARINVLEQELDQKQVDGKARETEKANQSEHLKKQIDLYIQEIDRCIEWLQKD